MLRDAGRGAPVYGAHSPEHHRQDDEWGAAVGAPGPAHRTRHCRCVRKALAPVPGDRFATTADFAKALTIALATAASATTTAIPSVVSTMRGRGVRAAVLWTRTSDRSPHSVRGHSTRGARGRSRPRAAAARPPRSRRLTRRAGERCVVHAAVAGEEAADEIGERIRPRMRIGRHPVAEPRQPLGAHAGRI